MNAIPPGAPAPDIWSIPLDQLNPGDPYRFEANQHWEVFRRLRAEAPIHYQPDSPLYGPYWSISGYKDIMQVENRPDVFSSHSEFGGITLRDRPTDLRLPMFIAMDPPEHGPQRSTVQPIAAMENVAKLEATIRAHAAEILDGLPRGEEFDWVDRVSIELTTRMLATLFDFPFEDRRLLPWWSDAATMLAQPGAPIENEEQREAVFAECLEYFTRLWNERVNAPPKADLISMMAYSSATKNMTPREYLGNLILLIVGGNDTTRNSITGGLLFLNQNPGEYAKLRENPGLIPNMINEIIRYQTPLAHMRRTALADFEIHGHQIRKGEKVAMWYVSANRDPNFVDEPDRFIIDRKHPKKHLSFGFGIHRCVGERLAELQLRVLWEEIMRRFPMIEVVAEPQRVLSAFVHGYRGMTVRIPG
jgi:cytochrome P450